MTKIRQTENLLSKKEGKLEWSQRLIDSLGDPSKYIYTGTVNDNKHCNGFCSCGHPIRYEFIVEHKETKKQKIIGSTCIDYFQNVNPTTHQNLVNAVDELHKQLAADKKATREMMLNEEIEQLHNVWSVLVDMSIAYLQTLKSEDNWLPHDAWEFSRYKLKQSMPEYKRLSAAKTWLEKQIKVIVKFLPDDVEEKIIEHEFRQNERLDAKQKQLEEFNKSELVELCEVLYSKGHSFGASVASQIVRDNGIHKLSPRQLHSVKDIWCKNHPTKTRRNSKIYKEREIEFDQKFIN